MSNFGVLLECFRRRGVAEVREMGRGQDGTGRKGRKSRKASGSFDGEMIGCMYRRDGEEGGALVVCCSRVEVDRPFPLRSRKSSVSHEANCGRERTLSASTTTPFRSAHLFLTFRTASSTRSICRVRALVEFEGGEAKTKPAVMPSCPRAASMVERGCNMLNRADEIEERERKERKRRGGRNGGRGTFDTSATPAQLVRAQTPRPSTPFTARPRFRSSPLLTRPPPRRDSEHFVYSTWCVFVYSKGPWRVRRGPPGSKRGV